MTQDYQGPFRNSGGLGLYQDRYRVIDADPPAEATNAPYEPEYEPLRGTIAGDPSTFVAHGIGGPELGKYPGAGRSSLIPTQLSGPQIVSPARTRDGYTLREAGTPEPAINAPKRGTGLDYADGVVRLGFGKAGVPITFLLLAIIAAAFYFMRKG